MKIESAKILRPEDFPGESEGFYKLLEILNTTFDLLFRLVRGKITLQENIAAEVIEDLEVSDDKEIRVKLQRLKTKPILAFVTLPGTFDYPRLAMNPVNKDEVKLKIKFDAGGSSKRKVNLVFFGE